MTPEQLEKKANSQGWYHRRFQKDDVCTSCNKKISEGFLLAPGWNYPLCQTCIEKEFA